MNINRLKVWLVLFFSTIVLISGVTASIIYSSSYLSPIGSNYAKEELQLLDELMSKDYIKLSNIFKDLKVSDEEKNQIDELSIIKQNLGKIKFIIQERDRREIYTKGAIITYNDKTVNFYERIGIESINFVVFIKKIILKYKENDCNDYFRNPYRSYIDQIEIYEIGCAFNKNESMIRIYRGDKYNTSYIISKSLPISLNNKVLGVIQIASDARKLEEKLGIILISILAPVFFSILLVSIFIFYLQYFLSTRVRANWINAKNIAHNIKNKTNAIKFYANKKTNNINDYKENITTISSIVDNLDNFIEDTLNTAKHQHYGIPDKNKKNSVVDLKDIINIIKKLYVSRDIIFFNNTSCIIIGEKNKLIDAISAAIDNSLYWNSGKEAIEVNIDENNNFIDLIISDRGPGILDEDKKNIFLKKYSKSSGNGIGLYIAKNIVVSYNGELFALDRDGGGLKMVFKFKVSKSNV
ncbi:HAMP domain-containing histidine kinase [Alphaproteobacteria bacterium]|nr:HAMP domain-containing histidine kinase [Alphaproteobacteria bacterium]